MLNNIFLKFSESAMLGKDGHPFSNKYGATAQAILTEYKTNEELVNASMGPCRFHQQQKKAAQGGR